jgi:alkanesulfonate monooxygenase SsuD/methylene tetrahydromethanopterin reductase-like flavin-dependent oxidoreductase (luciferase family)
MVEFAAMHNGSTNLPVKVTDDGNVITDAPLREVHRDCQQLINDQIEQAILAEKKGFDRVFYTEHHFELTAAEFSPNPMMSQMAVAAQTDTIRLCQGANILSWQDPVRFAEQAATLDVYSGGRAEIGIGRGYQPRECEVLGGQYWGGTIQDQEKNRASFEEKFDIIRHAWTEDRVSYDGEFHSIPPSYTKHHLEHERAYLEDEVTEHEVEDFMDWKEGDLYSADLWNDVVSGGTTLNAISVFPQPIQEPFPPLWQPVGSYRSVAWAAQHGINGISFGNPNMEKAANRYYEAAEEADWPDIHPEDDGEPFEFGWDSERQRGIGVGRWIFNTEVHDEETFEQWKRGLEHTWNYFAPFGFAYPINRDSEAEPYPNGSPTAEQLIETDVAMVGDKDEIIDKIASFKEDTGFYDLNFLTFWETSGVGPEVADEQLSAFADDVMPYLEQEFPSPGPTQT